MKTVVVTGASSGIGRATALEFARAGYRVFATVRRQSDADTLRRDSVNLAVEAVLCDVRDLNSVRDALSRIRAATDRLDVLVNNAGYGASVAFPDMSVEDFWAMFETNVRGLVAVTKEALPLLRPGSTIANVSSLAGRIAAPLGSAYSGTKFAVEAISDALRMELLPFGVRVVLIEPGPVDRTRFAQNASRVSEPYWTRTSRYTPVYAALREDFGKPGLGAIPAQRVARVVRKAAEARRPKARYVTQPGQALLIRLSGLFPRRLVDRGTMRYMGFQALRQRP